MEAQQSAAPQPVGYCAIVMPDIDYYQAAFIIDAPEAAATALSMSLAAMLKMGPQGVFGAMQAALVEGVLTSNPALISGAGLSLRNSSGNNYFYVVASKDAKGTRTELFEIEADSPEHARDMIHALPQVLDIQRRLAKSAADIVFGEAAVH